ncbi:carboxyl transferase domain-containing protein [Streptomyces vilmorinianum]|uniref:carboxyl transferase domain-containing protein n=1 Tax=Streptomyces vilmorinianum TaxID=3051092 RepID=UPI0010FB5C86|nr:carboxyl transferase domain-containing protein [Streptomyces vilmorinianum]
MTERLAARDVIALVTDDFAPALTRRAPAEEWVPEDEPVAAGEWTPEDDAVAAPDGPLGWPGYDAARARAAERTGEEESVVHGTATVGGRACVLVAFEFGFLGGSLGQAAGDRLVAAYRTAAERRIPLVSLVATGGSRMQEGMIALTQLQRVAAETVRLREAGVPHVTVLRDPSTGGGWATVGAGADVILALPSAQVAFAGSRVRPPHADPTAYTAEDQWDHGHVDALVPPEALRGVLALWLRLLTGTDGSPVRGPAGPEAGAEAAPGAGGPAAPAARRGNEPEAAASASPSQSGARPGDTAGTAADPGQGPAGPEADPGAPGSGWGYPDAGPKPGSVPAPAPPPRALAEVPPPGTGWAAVSRARDARRPRAGAYLEAYFGERAAIRGDRVGGVDPGVECGFGIHAGRVVAYAAQDGSPTRPAGYRTVARLVRLADRLGIPVLTLIDTPGAANDAEAERAGAGPAIADAFAAIAGARVPVTSLLIGEGGSGGALALAAPGNTWATPDGYFSVIAPELAAAILKRTPDQAPVTADQLRLRPQDLVDLGVVRGIVTRDA